MKNKTTKNIFAIAVAIMLLAVGCQPKSNKVTDNLVIAGKVTNSETGSWPNDRLVVILLNGKEIGRGITSFGELPENGLGKIDGLFKIVVPNSYELNYDIISQGDNATLKFGYLKRGAFDNIIYLYHWLDEIEEGGIYHLKIPAKNLDYIVKVFAGEFSSLPSELRTPGSIQILPDGTIITSNKNDEPLPSTDNSVTLQEVVRGRTDVEIIDTNNFTIPLNNCGGNGEIVQRYLKRQTYSHEYIAEVSGGVSDIWKKVAFDIEGRFGYKHGQIDEVEVEITLTAPPKTDQVYTITWQEVWEPAIAKVASDGATIELPFKVKTDLIYKIESQAVTCP